MKLIDKFALVAEIERLKSIQLSIFSKGETEEDCYNALSCISVYNEILSFLESLEEKEFQEKNLYVVTRCEEHSDYVEKVFFSKKKAEEYCKQFEGDEDAYGRDITEIKVDCPPSEVKKVDLEKEAENFVQTEEFVKNESPVLAIAKHFYELGLKSKIKQ